jgi:hypothetical protein
MYCSPNASRLVPDVSSSASSSSRHVAFPYAWRVKKRVSPAWKAESPTMKLSCLMMDGALL